MAVQSDWQKYASAFADWQARGGRASGPPPQAVRDMQRSQLDARVAESKAKGYGPAQFKTVNAAIDKQLAGFEKDRQKLLNQEIANKAPKHARLIADLDSSVFESVTWKEGVLTCSFWRGGALVYDYTDVSREDFVAMVSSGSLGGWFNENLR